MSSATLPGVGGRGGRLVKGEELLEYDWRTLPPNPMFRFPGKGGGVSPRLACLDVAGTGGGPLLYRFEDGTGLGVFGTGGAPMSGLEPASGLGGGIRFLCGSGVAVLGPREGPGNLPTAPEGEKGFANVTLPPGGKTGALPPGESENARR